MESWGVQIFPPLLPTCLLTPGENVPDCCFPQANVMLEYDIDEAQALLEKNLSTATRNLETLENDLDFLRDQFTTTEVSILALCWHKWGISLLHSGFSRPAEEKKPTILAFYTFFLVLLMEFIHRMRAAVIDCWVCNWVFYGNINGSSGSRIKQIQLNYSNFCSSQLPLARQRHCCQHHPACCYH